jgi:hypothetical protein
VYTGMVYLHRESLNGVVTGSTWEIFYHKIHKEMVPRTASLKAHIMVHEKEETLMCTECGDEFGLQVFLVSICLLLYSWYMY